MYTTVPLHNHEPLHDALDDAWYNLQAAQIHLDGQTQGSRAYFEALDRVARALGEYRQVIDQLKQGTPGLGTDD